MGGGRWRTLLSKASQSDKATGEGQKAMEQGRDEDEAREKKRTHNMILKDKTLVKKKKCINLKSIGKRHTCSPSYKTG